MKRRGEIKLTNGGSVWYGRNERRHGHEHYIGFAGEYEICSIAVPEVDRKRLADFLDNLSDRLRNAGGR